MTAEPPTAEPARAEPARAEPARAEPATREGIDAIAVIVPARNEEELLPRCLSSLAVAIEALHVATGDSAPQVCVVVVLDSCTDASGRIVSRWPSFDAISGDMGAVGAARRAGVRHVLRGLRESSARIRSGARAGSGSRPWSGGSTTWLVTTDADSAVPESWLTSQLAFARNGAELVLGTVQPDAELPHEQQARWAAMHSVGEGHPHIHGSNLGVRADRYLAAGGFPPVEADEDVMLVAALRALGGREVRTASIPVLTSGRLHGRAPRGFAEYLLRQETLMPGQVDSVR